MSSVLDSKKFRENVVSQLAKYTDTDKIAINLEKSIYNYTIQSCKHNNIIRKWTNELFILRYKSRFYTIWVNINNNAEFLDKINNETFTNEKLAKITHQEIMPAKWNILLDKIEKKQNNLYTPVQGNTDIFNCSKCKRANKISNNCSYYQLQTISADEPMTTFVTCLNCGNRWKC